MGRESSVEARLIQDAAAGNMGAFAQLVNEHRERVIRTAYGIVGSLAEAEDVAQEVFIKVWNSLPDYHAEGPFAGWIYRIAVNAAIDSVRRRRKELSLDEGQHHSSDSPEDTVLREDVSRRLQEAIRALPESARAALVLREYEQLSYKEIAQVLQIPIGTVMSRLNYARQALKKALPEGE